MAKKKDNNTPDDPALDHDQFEEEFDFDSSVEDDALAPDELDEDHAELEEDEEEESDNEKTASSKSMMLPVVIILAVFGFIAWKLYGMFFAPKAVPSTSVSTPVSPPSSISANSLDDIALNQNTTSQVGEIPPSTSAMPNTGTNALNNASQITAHPSPTPSFESSPQALPQSTLPAWEESPNSKMNQNNNPVNHQDKNISEHPATMPAIGSAPVAPPANTVSDAAFNQFQKKIEDEIANNKKHLQMLDKDVSQALQNTNITTKNLSVLQHDIASLSAAVAELTAEFKAMNLAQEKIAQERAQVKATMQHKKSPSEAIKKASNPTYSVYAIIPGRAWLRQSNGKTITVSEGDSVGEYGKILKIDAGNGVVITTSGVTLR